MPSSSSSSDSGKGDGKRGSNAGAADDPQQESRLQPQSGDDDDGVGADRVRFEDILKYVGNNGKWQIVIFLFLWIEGKSK